MATTQTPGNSNEPLSGQVQTEADVKSADGNAGQGHKSSNNEKSHTKAGSDNGAGGGKKQERHH